MAHIQHDRQDNVAPALQVGMTGEHDDSRQLSILPVALSFARIDQPLKQLLRNSHRPAFRKKLQQKFTPVVKLCRKTERHDTLQCLRKQGIKRIVMIINLARNKEPLGMYSISISRITQDNYKQNKFMKWFIPKRIIIKML